MVGHPLAERVPRGGQPLARRARSRRAGSYGAEARLPGGDERGGAGDEVGELIGAGGGGHGRGCSHLKARARADDNRRRPNPLERPPPDPHEGSPVARPRVGRDRHRRDLVPGAPNARQPSLRAHAAHGQGRAQSAADRPLPRQRPHRRLAGAGERADARPASGSSATQLAELRGQPSPPPALRAMRAPLRANFATLDQIYAVGITKAGYDHARRPTVAPWRAAAPATIEAMLDAAGRDYEQPRGARAEPGRRRLGCGHPAAARSPSSSTTDAPPRRAPSPPASHAENAAPAGREPRGGAHRRPHRPGQPPRARRRPRDRAARRRATSEPRCSRSSTSTASSSTTTRFGHPAGDALLVRLGERLQRRDRRPRHAPTGWAATSSACSPPSAPAAATSSCGCRRGAQRGGRGLRDRLLARRRASSRPRPPTPEEALRLADQRMYAHKADRPTSGARAATSCSGRSASAGRGSASTSTASPGSPGAPPQRLGLPEHEVKRIRLAAELHDIGKTAIPDAILNKPGALDDEEWEFMRRHTVIGERIIRAAPSLGPRRRARPLQPRALRRRRLPRRPRRRRDPDRRAHHRRLRRLRRDGLRPALPRGDVARRRPRRAAQLRRHAVRPGRRRGLLHASLGAARGLRA